ncbi:MAG: histidine ammonia-lyase [Planctomycetota bacterium]
MAPKHDIELTGAALTTGEVEQVARHAARVGLGSEGQQRLRAGHERLHQALNSGAAYYGINTGFGALGRVKVNDTELHQLQVNLIRSHSTGAGDPLSVAVVRATMLLLAASLTRGYSGVRPCVVETLLQLINADVTPAVPELGSVGASGDLAPLAHIAQVLMGEGEILHAGQVVPAAPHLQAAQIEPVALEAKEGLALINGTHLMAGRGALLMEDCNRLFDAALVAAAMSVDTCRATDATLDARVHEVRGQPSQQYVASCMLKLLAGSEIMKSHIEGDSRVQDPYSFRCCPAVLGAVRDAMLHVRVHIETELGGVTDNPLIFPTENGAAADIVTGGNFHGMPLAIPLDLLGIAVAHLAGISERRIFHMLSGADPEAPLPTFLTPKAGLQSGLMIAQYTAAACCNELIGLANPASVANLSTSAGMEDYNSFGPRSAAKADRAVRLARTVVAIELLCAATGLDHHRPLTSGPKVEHAFAKIREVVAPLDEDRSPAPDIRAIEQLIDHGVFLFSTKDGSQ